MALAHKLFTSLQHYVDPDTRIGELNRIWYDGVNNVFRIQLDTTTPGGTIIGGGSGGGGSYTLLAATSSVLGGVKIGANINITAGVISVAAPFSGSYVDLTNKPTLFSGSYTDLTNKPTLFDGVYASLSGKPTIPSNTNELTNGAGYITNSVSTLSSLTSIGTLASLSVTGDITLAGTAFDKGITITGNRANIYIGNSTRDARTMLSLNSLAGYYSGVQINRAGSETWFVGDNPSENFVIRGNGITDFVSINSAGTTTLSSLTATSATISGGTINNTVIGATTPAAGTVTTFSVAGSLQNLFLQSQTFGVTGTWTNTALTINQIATTAPDSTSTGNSLIPTAVSSIHRIVQYISVTAGVTYTISVYAKAAGYNYLFLNAGGSINAAVTFNLSTGVISNTGSGTATITSVGSDWYRCIVTGTATVTASTGAFFLQVNSTQTLATDDTFTGDSTSGIYLWGSQAETSATVHAYQVTTTAASSSNPKISLSGGGSIGLESTGSMYLQPAGTGALQAQATTSTAVGGNARGANAVDWQTIRSAANQVASGYNSVIGGGSGNKTGYQAVVAGGSTNSAVGNYTFVGGGNNNSSSVGSYAIIVGGNTNIGSGHYGFIGGGFANSNQGSGAVTTQATTIARTAVNTLYLTATNASIKIGQLVDGTGVTGNTYATSIVTTGTTAGGTAFTSTGSAIAVTTGILTIGTLTAGTIVAGQAITGTGVPAGTYIVSNIAGGSTSGSTWNTNIITAVASTDITGILYSITISQNATIAAGVTLSFYTPHGVVVGGGNNQASGSYSFVGAGGDAGTSANRNIASGDWSTVGGGFKNVASGQSATIAGGGTSTTTFSGNTASGAASAVGGGLGNLSSGFGSVVGGGRSNIASGQNMPVIAGGDGNQATSLYTGILGGNLNIASTSFAAIVGGGANASAGLYGLIGNGYTNSNNSASAVTSNNTTIAVTASTTIYLSSTNGNIRVGQLLLANAAQISIGSGYIPTAVASVVTTGTPAVLDSTSSISVTTLTVGVITSGTIIPGQVLTGTGVTAGTYIVSNIAGGSTNGSTWTVSASQSVSGQTLTATAYTITTSQAVTLTAVSSISAYNAFGTVVNGANNQATGNYSFIGGGGDAGTAANRNIAAGDWGVIGGGFKNVIGSGNANTTISGGMNHVATSGGNGTIGGGNGNSVGPGYAATVAGGASNIASGSYSTVVGGVLGTTRGISAYTVISASQGFGQGSQGQLQSAVLSIGKQTTDATATVLSADTNTGNAVNQVILPNNSAYYFKGSVIAGVTGAGNSKAWSFEGAIKRGAGVGTTAIIGTVVLNTIAQDAGASTWVVAITADTANGALAVTVTGQAATTIRWVCKIETTEMAF